MTLSYHAERRPPKIALTMPFYGVTLACERIERLCKGPNHGEDNGADAQEGRRPPVDDSDIPF